MATHSSILAWEIPWREGPGGLHSMGSQRVRHDLATKKRRQSIIKLRDSPHSLKTIKAHYIALNDVISCQCTNSYQWMSLPLCSVTPE